MTPTFYRIAAILSSVTMVGMMVGLMFPLLSMVLEQRGYSYALIGIHGSLTSVAVLLLGAFMPALLARFSPRKLLFSGCVLLIISWLGLAFTIDIVSWFLFRFLLGAGICFMWTISETWLNSLTTDQTRGRVIGLYGTCFSVGLAVGPLLLTVIGVNGRLPFFIGAFLVVIVSIPYWFVDDASSDFSGQDEHSVFSIGKKALSLYTIGIVAGFIEVAIYALLPLYGEHLGLSQKNAITLFTYFVLGNILAQPFIGVAAGKWGAQKVIAIAMVITLLNAFALPYVIHAHMLLMLSMFLWGAAAGALYTGGIVGIGHYFKGTELAAANAGFIMMYAIGMLVGPSLAGASMQLWQPQGYIAILALVSFSCLLVLLWRGFDKP